jgi:hypothetical protein
MVLVQFLTRGHSFNMSLIDMWKLLLEIDIQ